MVPQAKIATQNVLYPVIISFCSLLRALALISGEHLSLIES